MSEDEQGNTAGLIAIVVFVLIVWFLRACFERADQTK